ncbi:hypothetical protein BD770DRAFT_407925 [Pilaira anomala]|nr:hypothetical protein BD770DRAFT_407925 [Pilaira anomala]
MVVLNPESSKIFHAFFHRVIFFFWTALPFSTIFEKELARDSTLAFMRCNNPKKIPEEGTGAARRKAHEVLKSMPMEKLFEVLLWELFGSDIEITDFEIKPGEAVIECGYSLKQPRTSKGVTDLAWY